MKKFLGSNCMPFYEFKCVECDKTKEELMSVSEYNKRCKDEYIDTDCSCGAKRRKNILCLHAASRIDEG